MPRFARVFVFCSFLGAFCLAQGQERLEFLQSTPGKVELPALSASHYAVLTCSWEFWPGELLDPSALPEKAPMTIPVPSIWSKLDIPQLASTGYGTYRLRVKDVPRDLLLGLRMSNTNSASRVLVEGRPVLVSGTPASSAAAELPRWTSQVVAIGPRTSKDFDIVVQVSSHATSPGGIVKPVVLGGFGAVESYRTSLVLAEVGQLGALGIVALYSLIFFGFRPKEKFILHFAALAIIFMLRVLCYGEFLLNKVIPGLPFEVLFKLGYLTLSLPIVFFSALTRNLFPALAPRWTWIAPEAAGVALSVYFILAPTLAVSLSLTFVLGIIIVFALEVLLGYIVAFQRRMFGASPLLAGLAILFVFVIHDMLVNQGIVSDPFLMPFGIVLLFVCFAIMTSLRANENERRRVLPESLAALPPKLSLSEHGLSPAESLYVLAVITGSGIGDVAMRQGVSASTVRNTLARAYAKLGVNSLSSLIALAGKHEVQP